MSPVEKDESKKNLAQRIRDLQKKIQDETYVNSANDRIALVMSTHIVDFRIDKNS